MCKVIKRFVKKLNYEIAQEKDPFHVAFLMNARVKEQTTDDDLVEIRGYYKGLRVAKEMLERTIAEIEEEKGV